jgi:predicted amidohydrolase YtcJ
MPRAGARVAEFAADRKGRLASGYLADFVVMSKPIFDLPRREWLTTKVVLTVVWGPGGTTR